MLFAWSSLATGAASLIQPVIAARVGMVRSVIAVQAASLRFLVVLGYVPVFWLVAAATFVRTALMNMAGPAYAAFCMGQVGPEHRAMLSSVQTIGWSLGWATGSVWSGWLRQQIGFAAGFNVLFAAMIALYVSSVVRLYLFFVRGEELPTARIAAAP